MWAKASVYVLALLDWLKTVVPSVTSVGLLIYNFMRGQIANLRGQLLREKTERQYVENRQKIDDANRDKSDSDVIDDAIRKGSDGTK